MSNHNSGTSRSTCLITTAILTTLLSLVICCFVFPYGRYVLGEFIAGVSSAQQTKLGQPEDKLIVVSWKTRGMGKSLQAIALLNKDTSQLSFLASPGRTLSIDPNEEIQQSQDGRSLRIGEQIVDAQTGHPAGMPFPNKWTALPEDSSKVSAIFDMDRTKTYYISGPEWYPFLYGDWRLKIHKKEESVPYSLYRGTGLVLRSGWMPDQSSIAIQTERDLFVIRVP